MCVVISFFSLSFVQVHFTFAYLNFDTIRQFVEESFITVQGGHEPSVHTSQANIHEHVRAWMQ